MEKIPSLESNRSVASQEIPRILWKPKVHECVCKSHPTLPVLSHSNTAHASPSQFLKTLFNNSYLHRPGLPTGRFALGLPTETKPYMHLSYLPYMPHARPIIW